MSSILEGKKPVNIKRKRLERFAGIFFILLLGAFVFIAMEARKENKKFLIEGIRTNATINNMEESGRRKNRRYTMSVSFFTKGAEKKIETPDTTGKSESEKKIDDILSKLTIRSTIGNYVSTTVSCNSDSYNKYRPGDRITVVYLKEDSTDLRLLEEIDGL